MKNYYLHAIEYCYELAVPKDRK